MEDEEGQSLSGNAVVTDADLRDATFEMLLADFLGPQTGEDLGLEDQTCKNRLLVQVGLLREDNQLSWGAVVEWLQKIFPTHQSADFRCLIERGIATTLSLWSDPRLKFLESNVNFEFVGPICDSIGVEREDLLEIRDFSERAASVEVTNGLIHELSNFVTREKIDPIVLVSWLQNFDPRFCRNGNIQKASKVLQSKLKKFRIQYRNYDTSRHRRTAKMQNFLQSPFELVPVETSEIDPEWQKLGVKKRMKRGKQEPEAKVIKEESEDVDIKPIVRVKEECLSGDEVVDVVQNLADQVENPDANKGEPLTLLDIAMLSVQKLTSVYGGKTDASKQVSLDLLKNQYNLTCKENSTMRDFENKIMSLEDNHSLVSPLRFLHYNAHFLVDIHDAIEQELMTLESSIIQSTGEKLGRDKNTKFRRFLNFSESATSRYIHMACDVLSPRAPAKQNYRRHWVAFCNEKNNPSQLAVNRSNRFNNYFEAAAGLIHHHGEIALFFSDLLLLNDDDCPNIILESVTNDANEGVIQALVCVLAIIYCKILGPYWQLLKSRGEYSLFSQYILCLYQKLLEWSKDASPLLEPESIANVFLQFPLQEKTFDGVFKFCGPNSENVHHDLIMSCLQKMVKVIAAVTEANLKEFLPGGDHCQIPSHELSTKLSTCTFFTLMGEYPFGHAYPYKKKRPDKFTNLSASSCYEEGEDISNTSEDDSPSRHADGDAHTVQRAENPPTKRRHADGDVHPVQTEHSPTKRRRADGDALPVQRAENPPTKHSHADDDAHPVQSVESPPAKRSYGGSDLPILPPQEGMKNQVKNQISLAVERYGGPCKSKQDVDRLLRELGTQRLFQRREAIRSQIGYQKVIIGSKHPSLNIITPSLPDMIVKLKEALPDERDVNAGQEDNPSAGPEEKASADLEENPSAGQDEVSACQEKASVSQEENPSVGQEEKNEQSVNEPAPTTTEPTGEGFDKSKNTTESIDLGRSKLNLVPYQDYREKFEFEKFDMQ